jgi:hypothetical protein
MPNIVKNAEDEKHWEEAKAQVKKEYGLAEGGKRFWKLVMGVFRRMKYHTGGKPAPAPELAKAVACLGEEAGQPIFMDAYGLLYHGFGDLLKAKLVDQGEAAA